MAREELQSGTKDLWGEQAECDSSWLEPEVDLVPWQPPGATGTLTFWARNTPWDGRQCD